jgi:anti-sigma-K factor RskA
MKREFNKDEIKRLIPDYITGALSDDEKKKIENAISSSPELIVFYNDVKSVLDLAGSVKFEEPVPQYWNNLLPRIHEKIEEREAARRIIGLKNPFGLIWKVLVPVTAIILIFVIYKIATRNSVIEFTNRTAITVPADTNLSQQNAENRKQTKYEAPVYKETNISKVEKTKKVYIKNAEYHVGLNVKDNNTKINLEKEQTKNPVDKDEKENMASQSIDELVYIDSGDENTMDDDMENELSKLNSSEQDRFLEKLSNANL